MKRTGIMRNTKCSSVAL